MDERTNKIKQLVIAGKQNEVEALVASAIKDGVGLDELINDAFVSAMDIVGKLFAKAEIFVPEMLASALIMKKGLEIIKPLLIENKIQSKAKIILCTVKGDLHDIGKNLVAMMLEGAGFEVIDLGINVAVEHLIGKIKELKPDVVGLSALLTTTMPEMANALSELKAQGLRDRVKVMVGGAPVSADFAAKIGADAYGEDAPTAVAIVRGFMKNKVRLRGDGRKKLKTHLGATRGIRLKSRLR